MATDLGNYAEAERVFERGIRLVEETENDRVVLAELLGNLGSVYFIEGNRLHEAERMKKRALDLAIESLGPSHPATGNMFL